MKVLDKNGKLLAHVIKKSDIKNNKNFTTENEEEFQFASFNLKSKNEVEDSHQGHKHHLEHLHQDWSDLYLRRKYSCHLDL